jgi:nucleotide-binding universal stress UspA family protein
MKIVLGLDASAHSQAALEFVRRMAWPPDSSVIVISSVSLPPDAFAAMTPVTGLEVGVWDKALTDLGTQLVANAERALREAGLSAESRVMHGDPRESLVDVAAHEGADLIVVGSHGRSGLGKLLLGSVASHLVAHAPCNVLVVKIEAPQP